MTNQQIIIDNKKRTVSSAKIKNAAPDVFAVRTHLFGQFDDIGFKKDQGVNLDEPRKMNHCVSFRGSVRHIMYGFQKMK